MKLFNKVKALLAGKKTYLVAVIGAVLGLAQSLGVHVPNEVYVVLSAAGLSAVRAGVAKK